MCRFRGSVFMAAMPWLLAHAGMKRVKGICSSRSAPAAPMLSGAETGAVATTVCGASFAS